MVEDLDIIIATILGKIYFSWNHLMGAKKSVFGQSLLENAELT